MYSYHWGCLVWLFLYGLYANFTSLFELYCLNYTLEDSIGVGTGEGS